MRTLLRPKPKSLMYKTLMMFFICAAVIFVLSVPLFHGLTERFYAEDMIDVIQAVNSGQGIPPTDLEEDIVEGMALQFALIFAVMTAALFITLRFATSRLWRPFEDTLLKTERFRVEKGAIPEFAETGTLEFERLNRAIAELMRKDKEAFRIQKEFTENASHELQTPLAVIRGKLDLLMQESLTKRQMLLVADIYAQTARISAMNRNLLLLAKIDNAQYTAKEETDVASLVAAMLPTFDVLARGVSITVDDRRGRHAGMLRANRVLLECLVKNLVVNAIRHTPAGGAVTITLEPGALHVSNPSADGHPLDARTLFQRFRSGDMQGPGNGLGLAIVKAVCTLHGWEAGYEFDRGQHRFSVRYGE